MFIGNQATGINPAVTRTNAQNLDNRQRKVSFGTSVEQYQKMFNGIYIDHGKKKAINVIKDAFEAAYNGKKLETVEDILNLSTEKATKTAEDAPKLLTKEYFTARLNGEANNVIQAARKMLSNCAFETLTGKIRNVERNLVDTVNVQKILNKAESLY